MRIALLGTRGIPAKYSGFETFCEDLGSRVVARGHDGPGRRPSDTPSERGAGGRTPRQAVERVREHNSWEHVTDRHEEVFLCLVKRRTRRNRDLMQVPMAACGGMLGRAVYPAFVHAGHFRRARAEFERPNPINAYGGSKYDHMTCEGAGSRLDVARAIVEHHGPSDAEVMYGTALRAKPQ